jgi:hypothetical protein
MSEKMYHAWERSAYSVLLRKNEGKRPLVRPRSRWEDRINKTGGCAVGLCDSGKGPGARSFVHNNKPSDCVKFWELLE